MFDLNAEGLNYERNNGLLNIKNNIRTLPESCDLSLKIGDHIAYYEFKDCIINEILYDGKIYGLYCTKYNNQHEYRITTWLDILYFNKHLQKG